MPGACRIYENADINQSKKIRKSEKSNIYRTNGRKGDGETGISSLRDRERKRKKILNNG
jgi:hypothetical protein